MLTRVLTALVLGPLVVWLILAGPTRGVMALLIVAAGICLHELFAMVMPGRSMERWMGTLLGVAGLAGYVAMDPATHGVLGAFLVLTPPCLILIRPEPMEEAAGRMLALWGGLFYILATFGCAIDLAVRPGSLMMAFVIIWAGDSGAYFVGKGIGAHKLYPLISPKKTVEGSIGGLAASAGAAFGLQGTLTPDLATSTLMMAALGGGALGQIGDLVESALKRSAGVKDSGAILPGHGGMLDRLDGFLFATPLFALLL